MRGVPLRTLYSPLLLGIMASEYVFIILCRIPEHAWRLIVALIFELTQEGLVYKYFGLGLAVLNAANGAILVDDQKVWIHFNIFAV